MSPRWAGVCVRCGSGRRTRRLDGRASSIGNRGVSVWIWVLEPETMDRPTRMVGSIYVSLAGSQASAGRTPCGIDIDLAALAVGAISIPQDCRRVTLYAVP